MPSLLEILQDPNYVNANEATKEAIFNKYSAQDKNYTDANNATKEAIRTKFGIGVLAAVAKPEPTKDTGIFSMTGRAIARGAKQTGSLLGDVLPAMAASAVGADEYAARQMAEAAETQKEIEQKYGARYKSLSDVKGIGDYIPFALETAAEQIPGMATALIPGAGLGVAGGRMAAAAAAKELAERKATQAGARYAGMKTAEGAMRGQLGGAFLGSYALNAPEVFQNIYEETGGQMEPAAAALAGSVSAALDSILPAAILRQMGPNVKAGVVENLLEKSGMPSPLARKVVGATVTGAATEGVTEAGQEAISIAAEKFVQENPEVWGSKEFNRLIESSVRGAVGGGAFGAAGAGAGAYLESRRNVLADRQLQADRREIIAGDLATQLGRDPTKEEIDAVVAATNRAREEMQDEGTSTDTGAGKPSVSISDEEGLGKGPTDTGAGGPTETDLDRINRLAADAAIREDNLDDQLKKDAQEKTEGVLLTPDAEALLKSVEAGGVPAMMTNNLKRIAKDNGIEVTPKDTPNSVIDKLQALKTTPKASAVNTQIENDSRAGWYLLEDNERLELQDLLLGVLEKRGKVKLTDIPQEYRDKLGTGESSLLSKLLKEDPQSTISGLTPKPAVPKTAAEEIPGTEVTEEDKTKLTPSQQAELERRQKYAMETAEQLEKDVAPRINAVDYVQKVDSGEIKPNAIKLKGFINYFGLDVPAGKDYVNRAFTELKDRLAAIEQARPLANVLGTIQTYKDQAGAKTTAPAQKTVQLSDIEPEYETIKSKPGVNAERITAMFSQQMYGDMSKMPQVAVKEMLQNSFDNIKPLLEQNLETEGNIDINVDKDNRSITVKDDATGMTPDVLSNIFFTVAGTKKETEFGSGGFGVAKMQFLYGSNSIEVITMRDGQISYTKTTGEDIKASLKDPSRAPNIEVTTAEETPDLAAQFPKGHGSIVKITIPKEYKDPQTGEIKEINLSDSEYGYPVLEYSPLFANITVNFNGYPVDEIGSRFDAEQYTTFVDAQFDWGTARIYVSTEQRDKYLDNVHVLSNGLWQFGEKLKLNPSDLYGDNIPHRFYLDIVPRVKPEEEGYPFQFNRQGFTDQAKKDLTLIKNYLSIYYRQKDFQNTVKNFGTVQYLDKTLLGIKVSKKTDLVPNVPDVKVKQRISEGAKVQVKDGKLIVNGKVVPVLTPEDLKKASIDVSELKIPQNKIKPNKVMIHDNLEVKVGSDKFTPITVLATDQFGDRFNKFMFDIGDAFMALRDAVVRNMPPDSKGVDYSDLAKEAIGVSFDKEYRGVSIVLPFKGLYINPAFPEYVNTPEEAALGMFGTMIHELAHHKVRNHGADFPAEMQRILIKLEASKSFDIRQLKDDFISIVKDNKDIVDFLNREGSNADNRAIGQRFKDSGQQARSEGAPKDISERGQQERGELGLPSEFGPEYQAIGSEQEPSGVPSKTPQFVPLTAQVTKFFAESKARDEDGRLLPLLHGTTATGPKGEGLTQIKLSKEGSLGGGIYLTPSTDFASDYSGSPNEATIQEMEQLEEFKDTAATLRELQRTGELVPGQIGGNIIPVFADIRNPLVINTTDRGRDPAVDLLVALDVPRAKAEAIVEKAYEDKGGLTKEVITRARAKGYDGIFQYKDGKLSEVVAFSPSQIKSVFNKDPSRLPELLNAFDRAENTSPKKEQVPLDDPLFSPAHPTVTKAIADNDAQGALKALKNTAGKFLSGLADRLMQLNLDTVVGFDDLHYDLAVKSLDRVKGQKDRVITWIKQVKPDVYASRFDESKMTMPITETLKAFQDLRDGKLGIDPKIFTEDLEDIVKVYNNAVTSLNAPGTFFMDDNAIGLSLTRGGNSNYAISHEFTHAATHWAIEHPDELNPKQRLALANLKRLFRHAKKHARNPNAYGYGDIHEFVAEAFSRPEFQNELRQMQKVMDTNMSGWSKFIQLVAQLFNIDNVLFHTLANADVLFSANSGSSANEGTGLLWAPNSKTKDFKTNPGERLGGLAVIGDLIKNRTRWGNANKNDLKKFFGSLNNQYRRYLLGALTVDQLSDIYGADMPQLKEYVKEIDAMIATRNAILKEGAPIVGRWSNLLKTNPKKAEQLGKTMIESTMQKMDPSILDPQLKQVLSKKDLTDILEKYDKSNLKTMWQELSSGPDGDIAVEIFQQVRNFYERRMTEYIAVQEDRIREAGLAKDLTPEEINAKLISFRKQIEESIIRPYFPIKRFGDYFLMVGRGRDKIFMQFEDAFARDAELEKQKARLIKQFLGAKDDVTGIPMDETEATQRAETELWPGQGFNEVLNEKLSEVTQLNKIKELVDQSTEDVLKSTDPTVIQDRVSALQESIKDVFGQYYLEMLPSESIKKMFLHRQNVAGPSEDMLRVFSLSYERIAYQRARFQHMPRLFMLVEAAKKRSMSMPTTDEKSVYGDVANELAKQFKSGVLEPPKHSKLTTFLTHFGFLNFLTSPASALVNMMAIPGLYIPVAGARYNGVKRVGVLVAKYTRMLGGTGYENEETGRYEFLSLARANLKDLDDINTKDGIRKIKLPKGKSLADVYTAGVNRNVIDTTLVHDSVSLSERPSEEYTGRWQKFMYYASLPFHAAEKFNREITYMTSFELAYEKNITDKKMAPEAAFDAALDQARDLTQETMFNYNSTNKPRYFRGNIASVLLQFKMYPQHMCVLMFRTFQKGWLDAERIEFDKIRENLKKAPKDVLDKALEEKRIELAELKKESRDAFLGMMGMSFLTAGMTGLPIWFIFSGVASAFHAAFGEDDEPFDPDNWFKNWANRTFGGFAGDTISRGLLSQATGMNFADRMNLNLPDMWFPDVRKSQSEVDYVQNMFINTLGPSLGALLVSYPEALKRFNDGHTERAMEALMPAGIKNVMVGTRYMTEGQALTLKGNTLVEDISARESLFQMLGFSPERVAQKQQAAFQTKNANESIMNRRTDLLNAFFIAVDSGDADMMTKVIQKMVKFSQTNPGVGIDPEKLVDSIEKRYRDRALANITGGMGLNKNLIPQLLPMLEYGEQ